MLNFRKHTTYLFLALAMAGVFYTGEAWADDVMKTIRDRAADILVNLKPVIFVLGGFGLIGFAFAAIFGKISWKWFSHIAMGLFLVANMGLFIDYFITKSGGKGEISETLGYGNYLDSGYSGTSGTEGGDLGGGNDGSNLPEGDDTTPEENTGDICTPACGEGQSCTGGTCVTNSPVDPDKDPNKPKECTPSCPPWQTCQDGVCVVVGQ